MMVICYFEKKTFVYIHLIFTLCANLQYISDHLKSNSSSASPSLTLGIPQCHSRGLRPQGRRDQLHPLWRGPLLNMTWVIEYPCGCSWKPSPCLSSSVIASSPAPAIRPTRRGDLPSLSGTLIRPLLSLHTHWIPATKAHHIPGDWRLETGDTDLSGDLRLLPRAAQSSPSRPCPSRRRLSWPAAPWSQCWR